MPAQYRFGEFKLLPAERLLVRRGAEVSLAARAFEVLVALVEKAGQLMSKDDLMARVWAGVIVEDNNIAVQIAVLRKVLGADAIATVAGFGYRFTLDVVTLPAQDGASGRDILDERTNLPARIPSLIGRESELGTVCRLLADTPWVTICGGPGVGKTRLALAAALNVRERYADGAFWVDLTPLKDGTHIVSAVSRAIGLKPADDADPVSGLCRRLKSLSVLVVLDNAEHLAADVSELAAELVRTTHHVTVLTTSQVPLHSAAEQLFRLDALDMPAPDASMEDALRTGSVRLLAERVSGVGGSVEWNGRRVASAADICRQLDGNPLAIELAAARIPALGFEGLAARLQQRLALLVPNTRVQPSRKNALVAALDWSHELLSPREQFVFRRLAVFPGSFALDWAALCVADDHLSAARVMETILDLVDRSLVSVDRATSPRYRLLETGRLYAAQKLEESGECDAARQSFSRGLRWIFDEAYEECWRTPQGEWHSAYEPELDNLWAALAWATHHDVETAVALFGSSWPVWSMSSLSAQARAQGDKLVPLLSDKAPKHLLARFWEAVSRCHTVEYPQRCRAAAELAAQLYCEMDLPRGEYMALVEYAFNWRFDHPQAQRALERAKGIEDPQWPAPVLERGRTTEATLLLTAGRFDAARATLRSAIELSQRACFADGVDRGWTNLADLERAAGNIGEAVRLGEELRLRMQAARPSTYVATVLGNLVGALIQQGDMARAYQVARECYLRLGHMAVDFGMWLRLDALALLQARAGHWHVAARLAGAADNAYRVRGQATRQPNEAHDRAELDRELHLHLAAAELETLLREGTEWDVDTALRIAMQDDGPNGVTVQLTVDA